MPSRSVLVTTAREPGRDAAPAGRRVRVLVIGPSLAILGGQAIQAQRLLEALRDHPQVDARFLPVNPRLPGPLGALQAVKYVRTAVTSMAYGSSLLRRVRGFDVLHILSASYWSFLLAPVPALAAGQLYRIPTILNYRSGEADDHLSRSPLARRLVRRFDDVVVGSPYLQRVFGGIGVAARVIPNIVNFGHLRFRRRAPVRPLFLSNRNLEPLYNVECTLRAYRSIARVYPDARLDVVGNGRDRVRLEALARAWSLPNVTFHGGVSAERMAELYDRADIFLNASNIDNMPTSILEAQACGLPVATTNAGGIPYIVDDGESGLLVPCGDHAGLAEAALRYLGDPALVARVTELGRLAAARYRPEAVAAEWVARYQAMAAAG